MSTTKSSQSHGRFNSAVIEKQKKELEEHIKEKREQLCHKGHDRVQTWMRSLNQEDAKAIADGAIR